jgi:hypothetical protein
MDIIRSDYSTLSPIAQQEAPIPPEYPYTDLLTAYRGALEDTTSRKDANNQAETSTQRESSAASLTSRLSNYTSYFQRVLEHFFEDYFQEDADEEIAHDMAQRWAAFARTGDPNYENSKVEWIPWRFVPEDDVDGSQLSYLSEDYLPWDREERLLFNVWRNTEDQVLDALEQDDTRVYTDEDQEAFVAQAYRARALEVLSMEVVEDDSLRTELIRNKKMTSSLSADEYTLSTFGRPPQRRKNYAPDTPHERANGGNKVTTSHRMIRQIQRMAQDMGVLGRGLSGEYDRLLGGNAGTTNRGGHGYWEGKIKMLVCVSFCL